MLLYRFRCEIPQCDTNDSPYNPDWLKSAVPFQTDPEEPQKCLMYHYSMPQNNSGTHVTANSTCSPEAFDINSEEKCEKWVFGENELTIVNDVSQHAMNNNYSFLLLPLPIKTLYTIYIYMYSISHYIPFHIIYIYTYSSVSCARRTHGNSLWWELPTALVSSSAFL